MPYKCCVIGCKSNYLTSIKVEGYVPVFHFPEDKSERDEWIRAVPRADLKGIFNNYETPEKIIVDGKEKTVRKKKPSLFVCRKHWPQNMPTFTRRGKECPINPPSIFAATADVPNVKECPVNPPSILAAAANVSNVSSRPTKRSLSSIRSVSPDQMEPFLKQDTLTFDELLSKNLGNVSAYKLYDDLVAIQSRLIHDSIPLFMIKVSRDLSLKTFHLDTLYTLIHFNV